MTTLIPFSLKMSLKMSLKTKHALNSLRLRAYLRRRMSRKAAMGIAIAYDHAIRPVIWLVEKMQKGIDEEAK